MSFAYRKTSVLYQIALGISALFSLIIAAHFADYLFLIVYIPLQLTLVLIILIVCEKEARKITKQYTDILDRELKPKAFLAIFPDAVQPQRKDGTQFPEVQLHLARAHWMNGDSQEAEEILKHLLLLPNDWTISISLSVEVVLTLMQIYLQTARPSESECLYEEQIQHMSVKQRKRHPWQMTMADAIHLYCTHDYARAVAALEDLANHSDSQLSEISCRYLLAQAYEKLGNLDQADQNNRYLLQNGGDTIYKSLANHHSKHK